MKGSVLTTFFTVLFLIASSVANADEVLISAAASTRDVVMRLGELYHKRHPEIEFAYNFGASGGIARQIEKGAPAQVYISANPQWMDKLIEGGYIDPATLIHFAKNALVVIGSKEKEVESLEDLVAFDLIAIGNPDSVPAGRYAKEALIRAGIYEALMEKGAIVMSMDVRQALVYAESGEVGAAFVYSTDVLLAKNTKVLLVVDGRLYPKIQYPAGLTMEGVRSQGANGFLNYLKTEEAKSTISSFGFSLEE